MIEKITNKHNNLDSLVKLDYVSKNLLDINNEDQLKMYKRHFLSIDFYEDDSTKFKNGLSRAVDNLDALRVTTNEFKIY